MNTNELADKLSDVLDGQDIYMCQLALTKLLSIACAQVQEKGHKGSYDRAIKYLMFMKERME